MTRQCPQWVERKRSHLKVPAGSAPHLDHIEVGRPLMLQACELGVAQCAMQVFLTLVQRCRIIGIDHRFLAKSSVIQMFNVHHWITLTFRAAKESR